MDQINRIHYKRASARCPQVHNIPKELEHKYRNAFIRIILVMRKGTIFLVSYVLPVMCMQLLCAADHVSLALCLSRLDAGV